MKIFEKTINKKMNIALVALTLAVIGVALNACNDILDEDPKGIITTESFYSTEEDVVSAINGTYNTLRDGSSLFRQEAWYISHCGTDIAIVNPGENNDYAQEMTRYTLNASSSRIDGVWSTYYSGIARANTIISRVGNIDGVDQELQDRVVGEAKFLRAFFYFMLTNIWGDVPLIETEVTNLNDVKDVVRTDKSVVYQTIIQDLKDAKNNLPDTYGSSDLGRATSGAATALLGKVYLFQQEWSLAADELREVVSSGTYDLYNDYAEVFYSANDNGIESIFEVQFMHIPGGQIWSQEWQETWQGYPLAPTFGSPEVPGGADVKGGGWGSILPTQEFFDSFDPQDARRDVNLYTEWTDDNGVTTVFTKPYVNKYNDERSVPYIGPAQTIINFKVLRYADVLLMLAEAINEQGGPTTEAYNSINRLRQRAGLTDYAGMDQTTFRDAILQERAWELAFEGHRRYDLARTGKLVEAVQSTLATNPTGAANVKDFHRLFPVPQPIIDVSPTITQNDGY